MSESNSVLAAGLDRALANSKREERKEREEDLARQARADERLATVLAHGRSRR